MSNVKIKGGSFLQDGFQIGLGGTGYVYVRGDGTPSENASDLQQAYARAKAMSPAVGNRLTVVVAPGTYTFGLSKFAVDTSYINIVSLTGNSDILIDGVNVTVGNVFLRGLSCGSDAFSVAASLPGLVCEACTGDATSFGFGVAGVTGSFINCTRGGVLFGVYSGSVVIDADGTPLIGGVGALHPVLTREDSPVNYSPLFYNTSTKRAETISGLAAKASLVNADAVLIKDSEDESKPKWWSFANIKANLKVGIYQLYNPSNSAQVVLEVNAAGEVLLHGPIVQTGTGHQVDFEKVTTKEQLVELRHEAETGMPIGDLSGFIIKLYDGVNDGMIVIDNNGVLRIGDVGDLQPVLTREEAPVDRSPLFFNEETNRAETLAGDVTKSSLADADAVMVKDSSDGSKPKWWSFANIKANLKTYFDPLYLRLADAAQTVQGAITFSRSPVVPDGASGKQAINYDDAVAYGDQVIAEVEALAGLPVIEVEPDISASELVNYRNEALQAKIYAETAESGSIAAQTKAEQWAEEDEDVEVETGKYSAKHWATKAETTAAPLLEATEVIMTNQAEIRALENVINSANINQETTATVTGVDTVALPKNAANTGMQVQLFGQSAEQLVVNGNFANGVPEWTYFKAGSTITASNGIATFTKTGASGRLGRLLNYIKDNKYYIMANVTKNEFSTYSALGFSLFLTPYTTGGVINITAFTTGKFSGIIQPTDDSLERGLFIQNGATLDIGKTLDFDWIGVINLTATFGAGNEPTKEQCDLLFANYFEGSDNVIGTGRVRSVGKNLINAARFSTNHLGAAPPPLNYAVSGNVISMSNNSDTEFGLGQLFKIKAGSYRIRTSSIVRDAGNSAVTLYFRSSSNTNVVNSEFLLSNGGISLIITQEQSALIDRIVIFKEAGAGTKSVVITGLQIENGSTETAYEPYKESSLYLTTPELRSNGLIKDEIRKGTNGYELVKRVGVGTLGSEKITTWSTANGITFADGKLTFTGTSASAAANNTETGFSIGDYMRVGYTIDSYTSGTLFHGNGGMFEPVNGASGAPTGVKLEWKKTRALNPFLLYSSSYVGVVSNLSLKQLILTDGSPSSPPNFKELANGTVLYNLATPVITPIPHAGLLNSNSNGTTFFEPIIADAGVYGSNLSVQLTDYPIASFESIRKYANGTYTELNTSTAAIASGGLSFTHPDLASGDLVMFTYAYNKESIGRSMTLTHYDSRFVEADTANGKVYRIVPVVTNGVVSWTAVEV